MSQQLASTSDTNAAEDEDIIGYVNYDIEFRPSNSTQCQIICQHPTIRRGVYVQIQDLSGVQFIGRIIDGPIYSVKGLYYFLELTSMIVNGVRTVLQSRPQPGSPTRLLGVQATQSYIGLSGDVTLGRLVAQKEVRISIDSNTLTRHIGIFGTTGSGKSNCLQVMAEEALRARHSVLIFDIEGEYVKMDEPTDELLGILADYGDKPQGVSDLKVYVPGHSTSLNPDAKKFGIPFADIDLEILSEILGLSPFERVYLFEVARKAKERSGNFHSYDLEALMTALRKRIEAQMQNTTLPEAVAEAHMGLYTKLSIAQRAGIVDYNEKISAESICTPGRVTVIDLNESSDVVRNICVAHFLREIFKYKSRYPDTRPIIVFVEEIHTFISKAKRKTMLATLTMLTEMARQGRKRGVCLGLVSQQPALVPSELIELCNTRLIHRVSSTPNVEVLRQSTGNVPDSLWSVLLSLGKGEALVSSPAYDHAVIAQIRPNRSRRMRIERSTPIAANSNPPQIKRRKSEEVSF